MLQRLAITALINFGCWRLAVRLIRRAHALREYDSLDCWKLRLILMTLESKTGDEILFRIILIGTALSGADKAEWSAFMSRWIWFLVFRDKITHALELEATVEKTSTSILEAAPPPHPAYYWLWI